MSADNFTGQYISDTYRRLLQLSDNGSYVTDGTGSVVSILPITASYALNSNATASAETDPIFTAVSASLITTGSESAHQSITGSVDISGSFGLYTRGISPPIGIPARVGLFYFTDTDLYISLE